MCAVNNSISDLCRQIAELEFALEHRLMLTQPWEAEAALAALRRRRDGWAEGVLLEYLRQKRFRYLLPEGEKAPLGLDGVTECPAG